MAAERRMAARWQGHDNGVRKRLKGVGRGYLYPYPSPYPYPYDGGTVDGVGAGSAVGGDGLCGGKRGLGGRRLNGVGANSTVRGDGLGGGRR